MATLQEGSLVGLYRGDSGAAVRVFSGHAGCGPVTAAAFAPDGTRLLSADAGGAIKLWRALGRAEDYAAGESDLLLELHGHRSSNNKQVQKGEHFISAFSA